MIILYMYHLFLFLRNASFCSYVSFYIYVDIACIHTQINFIIIVIFLSGFTKPN